MFVNTKPANMQKFSKKAYPTVQYTLIKQSGNYANWQVALKFSAFNCLEMGVVREKGFSSDSGNMEHNWGILEKNLEHCSKAV